MVSGNCLAFREWRCLRKSSWRSSVRSGKVFASGTDNPLIHEQAAPSKGGRVYRVSRATSRLEEHKMGHSGRKNREWSLLKRKRRKTWKHSVGFPVERRRLRSNQDKWPQRGASRGLAHGKYGLAFIQIIIRIDHDRWASSRAHSDSRHSHDFFYLC